MAKELPAHIITAEERAKKIVEEAAAIEAREKAEQDARRAAREKRKAEAATKQEIDSVKDKFNIIGEFKTREELLDKIREMRENPPAPPQFSPAVPPPLSEYMQTQLNAEQEAGRAAVAKARAELERNTAIRKRIADEDKLKEGEMTPVHHPNPGVGTVFPTTGATIK